MRALTVAVLLASCTSSSQRPSGQSPRDPVATSPTVPPGLDRGADAEDAGEDFDGTDGLTAQRRASLGLPEPGQDAAQLQPVAEKLWAEPEAVAARFVLADTNYAASEDPPTASARGAAYATDRLRADLAASSSGAAGRGQLQRRGVVSHGEVLGVATAYRADDSAVVIVAVRRSTTVNGSLSGTARVGFYRLTLSRNQLNGRWLVARAELS